MAGNRLLARTMREIEPLTALAIVHYEAPEALACPATEHAVLADAIEPLLDPARLVRADDPALSEHAHVSDRPVDVLAPEPPVEADGDVDRREGGVLAG